MEAKEIIMELSDAHQDLTLIKGKLKNILESTDWDKKFSDERDHVVKKLRDIDQNINDLVDIQRNILVKIIEI
jgi:hypothetical protein